jgi:hypothetical protein
MMLPLGMQPRSIISRGESLQILENDLRRAALERHTAELEKANAEERARIMAEIDRGLRKEVSRRMRLAEPGNLLH